MFLVINYNVFNLICIERKIISPKKIFIKQKQKINSVYFKNKKYREGLETRCLQNSPEFWIEIRRRIKLGTK